MRVLDLYDWEFQSAPRDFSRGDRDRKRAGAAHNTFQSAPRDFSRGDKSGFASSQAKACFNPRPVISHGAIGEHGGGAAGDAVSIRAP